MLINRLDDITCQCGLLPLVMPVFSRTNQTWHPPCRNEDVDLLNSLLVPV